MGFSYLVGKNVKYRYIEIFVFDYDSLPISFQSGITFPLVALDKILSHAILIACEVTGLGYTKSSGNMKEKVCPHRNKVNVLQHLLL